jgi:hypothetical protein
MVYFGTGGVPAAPTWARVTGVSTQFSTGPTGGTGAMLLAAASTTALTSGTPPNPSAGWNASSGGTIYMYSI